MKRIHPKTGTWGFAKCTYDSRTKLMVALENSWY